MVATVDVLYRDHAPKVWRYVRARVASDADAEDVTADTFLRAHRSIDRFDPTRGEPGAWLTGIARNAVADHFRRRRPEDPTDTPPDAITGDEPGAAVEASSDADHLRSLLAGLSDREREAVAMRFGAELSSAQIGEALGISPTAARMLVHRAVTKLRGAIDV